ncbi:MAG: hypothetical protein ACM3U1_07540 [Chloroflexota bacterium]
MKSALNISILGGRKFSIAALKARCSAALRAFGVKSAFLLSVSICSLGAPAYGQQTAERSSPADWRYPEGGPQADRRCAFPSDSQDLKELILKWSTPLISGDVSPVVGDIIRNRRLVENYPYLPNEIAAVCGDRLVIFDGAGELRTNYTFPANVKYVRAIAGIFDTTAVALAQPGEPSPLGARFALGLETTEHRDAVSERDTLAFGYVASFDSASASSISLMRLAVDLKPFAAGAYVSVKPFYARREGASAQYYAILNASRPDLTDGSGRPRALRALTQFNADKLIGEFPLTDIGEPYDVANKVFPSRMEFAPEAGFAQPSLGLVSGKASALLPTQATTDSAALSKLPPSVVDRGGRRTFYGAPYLLGYDVSGKSVTAIGNNLLFRDLTSVVSGFRPIVRPYFLNMDSPSGKSKNLVLVAESYTGLEGSAGKARLHLYEAAAGFLTTPGSKVAPSWEGGLNHGWSVATGNLDGVAKNEFLPYYPNKSDDSKEIVVTQSTREAAYAQNKIIVLRYDDGPAIPKASPPNATLFPFDTVCAQRFNGWLAAVNDIDGKPDGKEELFVVDGSRLFVLTMRDYSDKRFRSGERFDTLFVQDYYRITDADTTVEQIYSVAVADLEGDGKNEIIVTTDDSLYVYGTAIANSLKITSPLAETTACVGELFPLAWSNVSRSSEKVNVEFIELLNGAPAGVLASWPDMPNSDKDVELTVQIPVSLSGKRGFFQVSDALKPGLISDRSAAVNVDVRSINIEAIEEKVFAPQEDIIIMGSGRCVDSVAADYSVDKTNWTPLQARLETYPDGAFAIVAKAPCMGGFDCGAPETSLPAFIRATTIAKANNIIQSATTTARFKPAELPVMISDRGETPDPTRILRWEVPAEGGTACDSVTISVLDASTGETLEVIGRYPAGLGSIKWNAPTNIPDKVIVRVCCEGSCYRSDLEVKNLKPDLVNIISPNPFIPLKEELEIVYSVQTPTTVTIRIYDQANRLVKEIISGERREANKAYSEHWDGRLSNGAAAANGLYYLLIERGDGSRATYPVYVKK